MPGIRPPPDEEASSSATSELVEQGRTGTCLSPSNATTSQPRAASASRRLGSPPGDATNTPISRRYCAGSPQEPCRAVQNDSSGCFGPGDAQSTEDHPRLPSRSRPGSRPSVPCSSWTSERDRGPRSKAHSHAKAVLPSRVIAHFAVTGAAGSSEIRALIRRRFSFDSNDDLKAGLASLASPPATLGKSRTRRRHA